MIIILFKVIGLVVAWAVFFVMMLPLIIFALFLHLVLPFLSAEIDSTVSRWKWPDKWTDFMIKITGVKV